MHPDGVYVPRCCNSVSLEPYTSDTVHFTGNSSLSDYIFRIFRHIGGQKVLDVDSDLASKPTESCSDYQSIISLTYPTFRYNKTAVQKEVNCEREQLMTCLWLHLHNSHRDRVLVGV
jgi:hypothetical protein